MAKLVGRRRSDDATADLGKLHQQLLRERVSRATQANRFLSTRHRLGNARGFLQDQSKWAWPKRFSQLLRYLGNLNRPSLQFHVLRHVHDQRVVSGAPFGREYFRDRSFIGGVRAETVNGFSRQGDEVAITQQFNSVD